MSILLRLTLVSILLCLQLCANSQHIDPLMEAHDSLIRKFDSDRNKKIEEYKNAELEGNIRRRLTGLNIALHSVKEILKKNIDCCAINKECDFISEGTTVARNGIFTNIGAAYTQRNLTESSLILTTLLEDLEIQKDIVYKYNDTLSAAKHTLDSLSIANFVYPSKSIHFYKNLNSLNIVLKDIDSIDLVLNNVLNDISDLKNKIELSSFEMNSTLGEVKTYQQKQNIVSFDREFPNIWAAVNVNRSFSQIMNLSVSKCIFLLKLYIKNNLKKIAFLLLLIVPLTFLISYLKKTHTLTDKQEHSFVLQNPLVSAFFVVINIGQFIFYKTPFLFSAILWSISSLLLSIVFFKYIDRQWRKFWIILQILFVLASFDNIILQASMQERVAMAICSIGGAAYASYALLKGHHRNLKEKSIVVFIALLIIFEVASFLLNIYGRFNLAKNFFCGGYINLLISVSFFWVAKIIAQLLALIVDIQDASGQRSQGLNINNNNKVPTIFYAFLVVGWLILVGRNFYSFNTFSEPLNTFLDIERSIGVYTFTIRGVFIFIIVMLCSALLSRLVPFLYMELDAKHNSENKAENQGLGSWLLLCRIFIICAGLYLGTAAAGISFDKITIILGALSVGIGLGLQGLVHNLVSGLIMAFEKPVNVGDVIDIDGKSGTMKSIGFRSSLIVMEDGATMVIPNGDLLNMRLVNWSIGKNTKRLCITISVSLDTDIENVKEILLAAAMGNDKVLKHPFPLATTQKFENGNVHVDLFFWVYNRFAAIVKNEVASEIAQKINDAKIVIAPARQDVYIHKASKPS